MGHADSYSLRHDLLIKTTILQITPIWQIPPKKLIISMKSTAALILSHKRHNSKEYINVLSATRTEHY